MYFKYVEELNRSNTKPYIFINCENDFLDIKKTQEINLINFFDGLHKDILKELDNILKYSINPFDLYINEEVWLRYKISHKIKVPAISEELKKSLKGNGKFKNNKNIIAKFVENKKQKMLDFKTEDFFVKGTNLNLFESSENTYESYDILIHKEAVCNNYKDLLYVFINCLFNSKVSYCIKKCEYCNKFYVARKTDNQYCQRIQNIDDKNVSCSQVVATLQRTYEYKQLMLFIKNFLSTISVNKKVSDKYILDYNNAKNTAKKQYFKDKDFKKFENFIKDYKLNNPFY